MILAPLTEFLQTFFQVPEGREVEFIFLDSLQIKITTSEVSFTHCASSENIMFYITL